MGYIVTESNESQKPLGFDLRTRIEAVLKARWPAPWFGGERQEQQIADLADAVIAALGVRAEFGDVDDNGDGVLADTPEELGLNVAQLSRRYVTDWQPVSDL